MMAGTIPGLKSPLSAWGLTGSDQIGDDGPSAFRRILLAVTSSKSSWRAVEVVARLAGDRGTRVSVIHFYERISLGRGAYIDTELPDEAERLVERVCANLESFGIHADPWTIVRSHT